MPELIDWPSVANPRAAARHVARALRGGAVVALPTEGGYSLAVSGLAPGSAARLRGPTAEPAGVALRSAGEARDWVPGMTPLGQRLARRLWPGPLTLEFTPGERVGLASRLPETVRHALSPSGNLRLHCPDHPGVRAILRQPGRALAAGGPAGQESTGASTTCQTSTLSSTMDRDDQKGRHRGPHRGGSVAPAPVGRGLCG